MVNSLAPYYAALVDRIRHVDGAPAPLPFPIDKQPHTGERLVPFYLHPADHAAAGVKPTGRVPLSILKDMLAYEAHQGGQIWAVLPDSQAALDQTEFVAFHPETLKQGNAHLHAVIAGSLEYWRSLDKHKGPLRWGALAEQADVYGDPASAAWDLLGHNKANVAFSMERDPILLLGCTKVDPALIAYEGEGQNMRIWLQRRSKTRKVNPYKLHPTAFGGVPSGLTIIEGLLKEAQEEASFPPEHLRHRIRHIGATGSFVTENSTCFGLKRHAICDVQLDPTAPDYIQPAVNDEEVDSFQLSTVPEVMRELCAGEFTVAATKVITYFLYRHGHLDGMTEADLDEVLVRCCRLTDAYEPTGLMGPPFNAQDGPIAPESRL